MKSWILIVNVFRRIRQDPRTLVMVALTPLFFIVLYGVSFSGTPSHLKVVIVNEDTGLASVRTQQVGRVTLEMDLAAQFLDKLDAETFDVATLDDPEVAAAEVRAGRAWAALHFPQQFSHAVVNEALRITGARDVEQGGQTFRVLPPETEAERTLAAVTLDNSNPIVTPTIVQAFNEAFSSLLSDQRAILSPVALLELDTLYGGEVKQIDYTAPGVIGFAITLITVMLTAISIVRERTSGTLTRLLIAPVRPWQVTLGYALAYTLVALFQVGELLAASHFLFGIRFAGHLGWVFLIVLVYTVGLQGVATLLSTLARNEFQAVQYILVILIPSIMMSGVFWPIEAMPAHVQPLAWLSPLTYANTALRDVMLRGWGGAQIALELSVLTGFALLMLALSVGSMRRQAYSA